MALTFCCFMQAKERCSGRRVLRFTMAIGRMTDDVVLEHTVLEKEQALEKSTLVVGRVTRDM